MSDLRELYQEIILDHTKRPRNLRKIDAPSHTALGHNPLCGDRATVYLTVNDGIVTDAAFEGSGCSISTASASMMTEAVKGRSVADVEALFTRFHDLVTTPPDGSQREGSAGGMEQAGDPVLGKLAVFSGVAEFPLRVKCASLPWHTLHAALSGEGKAQTE
jgi:nitrogen fixation NifU-like protein